MYFKLFEEGVDKNGKNYREEIMYEIAKFMEKISSDSEGYVEWRYDLFPAITTCVGSQIETLRFFPQKLREKENLHSITIFITNHRGKTLRIIDLKRAPFRNNKR